MNTNYQMLTELLETFKPKRFGIIDLGEIRQIRNGLCLKEMDVLQLRNMRDFTVAHINSRDNSLGDTDYDLQQQDIMSAIVSVIDDALFMAGAEV